MSGFFFLSTAESSILYATISQDNAFRQRLRDVQGSGEIMGAIC